VRECANGALLLHASNGTAACSRRGFACFLRVGCIPAERIHTDRIAGFYFTFDRYVFFRPDVGYVQGMSHLAAMLLLNLDVFPAFVAFANLLQVQHGRAEHRSHRHRDCAPDSASGELACALLNAGLAARALRRRTTSCRSSGWTCRRSRSTSTRSAPSSSTTWRKSTRGHSPPLPEPRPSHCVQRASMRWVSAAHPTTSRRMLHRFRELEINPNMYLLNWLMALYTKSLPLDLVRSGLPLHLRNETDPRACRSHCRALAMPLRPGYATVA
jgi:hypothetical protein